MLHLPHNAGKLSYGQTELIHTIRRCGLTSGLKLCLDAGDANSYSSGQSWLDTSGNGYDFFRGATSGAEGSDPTFNGTAGRRSSGEYWSFDGGDFFRYDTTNETWMNNLHKDNAKFTFFAVVQPGGTGAASTRLSSTGVYTVSTCCEWVLTSSASERQTLAIGNGASEVLNQTSVATIISGATHVVAVTLDESVGADGGAFFIDGTWETFTSTYASPSTGSSGNTMHIGCRADEIYGWLFAASRLSMFAAWEGVALSKEQLNALYMHTRGRFGV